MADYASFLQECKTFLFDTSLLGKEYRVYDSYIQRFAYGIDASCYRYIPKLVLKPKNEAEIIKIIKLSNKYNVALTFKGSGTSLSGQASCDSVLVITASKWQEIKVLDDSVWLDCGVIGVEANNALKPFNKKIGPDPATINNASIGGIFSNNSSGMCCGTKQNSYQTIKAIRVILNDGTLVDTSDEASFNNFLNTRSDIVNSLLNLRQEVLADQDLTNLIKRKYQIKNTTGYGLNSLVDFEDIKDIFNHIFIGAEGTLGFVSRVQYETVDDYLYNACALLCYKNNQDAALAVKILAKNKDIVSAGEFMDYKCLIACRPLKNMIDLVYKVQEGNCCILVQLQSNDKSILEQNIAYLTRQLQDVKTLFGIHFSQDEKEIVSWWKIRKSILPIAASTRPKGSTCITEDICFEIDNFGKGIAGIENLFNKYELDGVIYGHVLAGNVHFNISPVLSDIKQRDNFAKFMDDLVEHVVALGGSTKAEHGTGRMMAPFVETEWGQKGYNINKKIKYIFDKNNLINPDVIICEDKNIHIKNLKPANAIEDYITQCMECGFCEKVCPSRDITLTPRQRIAVVREIRRLEAIVNRTSQEQKELSELKEGYKYYGIQSCATCSSCKSVCPLEIDTAQLAINIQNDNATHLGLSLAKMASKHMSSTISVGKFGLKVANFGQRLVGDESFKELSLRFNHKLGTPIVNVYMPYANDYKLISKIHNNNDQSVVYFSSCMNRAFAPNNKAQDKRSIQQVFESICAKALVNVIYPNEIKDMCCGKAFKNFTKKDKSIDTIDRAFKILLNSSKQGQIKIVIDHSACAMHMLESLKDHSDYHKLQIYDMPDYINEILLPRLNIQKINEDIGIYNVCSLRNAKRVGAIEAIAKACTNGKVLEDQNTLCCGFAGNKGFSVPKLNISATYNIAKYFKEHNISRLYSSSSSCEVGLSDSMNKPWQHIAYLVDELSS